MQLLKKVWLDPVWSKVIAAGILAATPVGLIYLLGIWPYVGSAVLKIFEYAMQETGVPNWVLALLLIPAATLACVVAALVWHAVKRESTLATIPDQYVEDEFFGVQWRWTYSSPYQPASLTTYCPRCDLQIYPRDVSGFAAVDILAFRCERCSYLSPNFEGSGYELEDRVKREIQLNIRNGSWINRCTSLNRERS